jgi:hypothetical protein
VLGGGECSLANLSLRQLDANEAGSVTRGSYRAYRLEDPKTVSAPRVASEFGHRCPATP